MKFKPASVIVIALFCLTFSSAAQAQKTRIYNTVKTKLAAGKQVVGGTITTSDPDVYCAVAQSGFDFLWIEMQHSSLNYDQVAKMIWACKDAPAIPFIRVPDATEGDVQKAMDIGALGIIVPMVEDPQKAINAVKFARYPPAGKRSQGGGQYARIWGSDYRQTINDNLMVVAMIENLEGVAVADKIAAVPGVDVVFAASGDLGSFTGYARDSKEYMDVVNKIHDATLKAGKYLAGPSAWRDRHGYTFFQGPSEGALIGTGAKVELSVAPAGSRPDVATGDETRR
jgi:2-keto-3-deoxy-L-rhamnonate aldolase RhmA